MFLGEFSSLEESQQSNELDVKATPKNVLFELGLFAIGNRKSKIENVVVPVVQRIERRFPKP